MAKSPSKRRRTKLRTPEEARGWLKANGVSITEFAQKNELSVHAVKEVLLGRTKASFGASHKAAVALGIKAKPPCNTLSRNSTQQARAQP